MNIGKGIDHLVYAVPDFEEGLDLIENLLGVRPSPGGQHPTQGTKNALLNLGEGCYFEVLAVDESNSEISPPRWMGIDLIHSPILSRWCLKSAQLKKDAAVLSTYKTALGKVVDGKRRLANGEMLSWELSLPLSEPAVEIAPFLIDWGNSKAHPTDNLPEICKLEKIEFSHPEPEVILPLFQTLQLEVEIKKSDHPAISAWIQSPKGLVKL
ncbi:MAG: VOC family protein [Bacteroidota bacterium]